ncbi:hypothetical protein [Streptomyces meridianus]|uniref:Type A2 lantipeptide n=1 Tax=Streptomyces meridianus TaxID=2938945 RepID=A0ABT0X9Y4_9ACTN|nr:hypothetical protein [Streptomyces meridianus]MCM2579105.1 hypothetical protein [Streptomyces meridianus]
MSNFTNQVETREIADADLDNVAGGMSAGVETANPAGALGALSGGLPLSLPALPTEGVLSGGVEIAPLGARGGVQI